MTRVTPKPITTPRGSRPKVGANTDETLRQTQMIAKGNIVLKINGDRSPFNSRRAYNAMVT